MRQPIVKIYASSLLVLELDQYSFKLIIYIRQPIVKIYASPLL